MGYKARQNPRSVEGGKPDAYASLHRIWRAAAQFRGDRNAFEMWIDGTMITDAQKAKLLELWDAQFPKPLVTIEHRLPS